MTRSRRGARSPRARALGTALADARKAAGLTQRATATRLGVHHTRIARAETGAHPPTVEATASILGVLGVTGGRRDAILEMARDIDRGNWTATGAGMSAQLTTLVDYETEASALTVVTPLLVPGLLQTKRYAHAIISAGDAGAEVVAARVMYRMGRQEILRSEDAPRFTAVCAEWALRAPTGGHAVMVEQLNRILDWLQRDNVEFRVLPSSLGATVAYNGNFSVYEFDDSPPVVHLEHLSASTFVDDARDVRDFMAARETVLSEALSRADSAALIADVYLPYHRERATCRN